jgi:hypothetical protein
VLRWGRSSLATLAALAILTLAALDVGGEGLGSFYHCFRTRPAAPRGPLRREKNEDGRDGYCVTVQ